MFEALLEEVLKSRRGMPQGSAGWSAVRHNQGGCVHHATAKEFYRHHHSGENSVLALPCWGHRRKDQNHRVALKLENRLALIAEPRRKITVLRLYTAF